MMHSPARRRATRRAVVLLLVAVVAVAACGPKAKPATHPAAAATAGSFVPAAGSLSAELDRIFGAPAFDRMHWAVMVQSLTSGAVLFERNASKLMMPASNMKVVTLAAAAERLGWDYHYKTTLSTSAAVDPSGTLGGDLVVTGTGDPTINGRGGSPTRVFEAWADKLREAGIQRIAGRIVADAGTFDPEGLGAGWAWDYLGEDYAAPVSALQYNEDVAELVVRAGAVAGPPASVEVRPIESGLVVDNRVTTQASGAADIEVRRLPRSSRVSISGTIPVGSKDVVLTVSVDDPALYFARVLRATLIGRGIFVSGEAVHVDGAAETDTASGSSRVLLTHESPPLAELARVLMKVSQNLYAETLLKTLGGQAGEGSARRGKQAVGETLRSWGIPPEQYILADGSGLSRYNYLCAEMLVRVLRQMYRDPRHREAFQATLPIGGRDGGTLARRFKGTRAEDNVRAKTGSIANVRALSGYVTTLDGEPLVFSILANGFTQPQSTIDAAIDLAVERLANVSRGAQPGVK